MIIGIVVDNYKLKKFREELDKEKLVFSETPFTSNCTAIKVICNKDKVPVIAKMCQLLEINFKQAN